MSLSSPPAGRPSALPSAVTPSDATPSTLSTPDFTAPDATQPAAAAPGLLDVRPLQLALRAFAEARDWTRFHAPKNLAMALTGEVGELVEIFQWLDADQSRQVGNNPATARPVRDELADVLIYLVRLADMLEVDLDEAVRTKLVSNAVRYPPLPGVDSTTAVTGSDASGR